MTITTNINGTTVINADEGKALRRKTDKGPTRITRVALAKSSSPDEWTDCDYAQAEAEDEADVRPAPRRWSRLSIKTALARAGMLSQALAYLAQVEIATGYSAAEALTDCDYIEEGFGGEQAWSALLDGAADALGKTREEIDAFLAQIPQEGGA